MTHVEGRDQDEPNGQADFVETPSLLPPASQHHSLKHHLLGPSLTKAGQDTVDQKKVAEVIYEASKGSKYFNNEEVKDKVLTHKIERILKLKAQLEKLDLKHDMRKADEYIASLELSRDLSQYVVHIDCDAFYAAVELIDRPDLEHVPFAVGQGVLTTCNYHARKFGCRSAMAGFVAKKLCPQLVCLPLNFEKYTAKAKEVRAVLAEYDPRFESSSIDEAYLNITEYCRTTDMNPEAAITQLRKEVQEKCKVTVSAGIAPNAKIAKICSNKNKPNGQFRIANDRAAVMSFMNSLPVRKVNGVGRVFERELQAIGVEMCGDIYAQRAYLNRLFGEKAFQFLMQTHMGLGRTDVSPAEEHERKSVGTESTFRDISDKNELRAKLRHRAEELEKDMRRVGVKGRTLVLKVKLHTYEVFTRQIAPPKAVYLADDLYNYSVPMLAKLERDTPDFKLRLMGLRCTHLVDLKRPDVDFFGRQGRSSSATNRHQSPSSDNPHDDSGEWEVWPDSEFEEAARQEAQEEMEQSLKMSQEYDAQGEQGQDEPTITLVDYPEQALPPPSMQGTDPALSTADWHEPFGRYKFGSEPNTPLKPLSDQPVPEEQWDCPICQQPQSANDRAFNAHIDSCLSRQTIREAVEGTMAGRDANVAIGVSATVAGSTATTVSDSGPTPAMTRSVSLAGSNGVTGVKRKASSSVATKPADVTSGGGKQQRKLFFA